MKRVSIALTLVVVSVASAQAQAVQRWSGFYLGLNGGYGWAGLETTDTYLSTAGSVFGIRPTTTAKYPSAASRNSFRDVCAGVQVGYNWQSDGFVAGVEADIDVANLQRSSTFLGSAKGPTYTIGANLDHFGTLRAKLAYATSDFLVYGTGGLAYGQGGGDVSATPGTPSSPGTGGPYIGADSHAHVGFVYGGGFEIAVTDTISLKAEYLHMDLGKQEYTFNLSPAPDGSFVKSDEAFVIDIVRAGMNAKF
jgi:outer membrane immunogenic protein